MLDELLELEQRTKTVLDTIASAQPPRYPSPPPRRSMKPDRFPVFFALFVGFAAFGTIVDNCDNSYRWRSHKSRYSSPADPEDLPPSYHPR